MNLLPLLRFVHFAGCELHPRTSYLLSLNTLVVHVKKTVLILLLLLRISQRIFRLVILRPLSVGTNYFARLFVNNEGPKPAVVCAAAV